MEYVDRELSCSECGATFIFTAGEQEFFRQKGFTHDPRRCKQCKAKIDGKLHLVETRVKCSECGIDTTVPFRPTQKRPVLCSACFQKRSKPTTGIALVKAVPKNQMIG